MPGIFLPTPPPPPPTVTPFTQTRTAAIGGVTFGTLDANFVTWVLEGITGWLDSPATRADLTDRPNVDGSWLGNTFFTARQIALTVSVHAPNRATLLTGLDTLAAATTAVRDPTGAPTPLQPLAVTDAGLTRIAYVRRYGQMLTSRLSPVAYRLSIPFVAPDPRLYDPNPTTASIPLPTVVGGLTFPLTWPLSWGAASSGLTNVVNNGNYSTDPVAQFIGPLTNPTITNTTTGRSLTLNYSIQAGDVITVDMGERTVMLNGTASRMSAKAGVWWSLVPGANQLLFAAGSGSGSASITYRSAWMS